MFVLGACAESNSCFACVLGQKLDSLGIWTLLVAVGAFAIHICWISLRITTDNVTLLDQLRVGKASSSPFLEA